MEEDLDEKEEGTAADDEATDDGIDTDDTDDFPMISDEENWAHEEDLYKNKSIEYLLDALEQLIVKSSVDESRQVDKNAANIAIHALKAIISTTQTHEKLDGVLLTYTQREQTEVLVKKLAKLCSQGSLNSFKMREKIVELDNIPLEVHWWLHSTHLVLLSTSIYVNLDQLERNDLLGQRMITLICEQADVMLLEDEDNNSDASMIRKIAKDLMTNIIVTSQLANLTCSFVCAEMIKKIIAQFLKQITSPLCQHPPCNFLELICKNDGLPNPEILAQLCVGMFHDMSRLESSIDMSNAFTMQTEWTHSMNQHFKHFLSDLCRCLGPIRTSELLENVVKKKKKHWHLIMSVASAIIDSKSNLFEPDMMKGLINKIFQDALYKADAEILAVAFLMARQCSVQLHQPDTERQSLAAYSSYTSWVIKSLSGKLTKRNFKFFYDTLTDWLPFEPAVVVQVHLGWTHSVPYECQYNVRLFINAARQRLSDLKFDVSPSILGKLNVQCDIDLVLSHYDAKGEILPALLGAIIIHRTNYEKHFVPRLLAGRHKTIIAALMVMKKIPKQYKQEAHFICKSSS